VTGGGYDGRRLGLEFWGGGTRREEGERGGGAWKKKKRERGENKGLSAILFLIPIDYNAPISTVPDRLSL
jgi:hypothetical protein